MSLETTVKLTKESFKAKLKLELALIGIGLTNKLFESCVRVCSSRLRQHNPGVIEKYKMPLWHRLHIDVTYTPYEALKLSILSRESLHSALAILDRTLNNFLLSCNKPTIIRFLGIKLTVTGDKKIKWEEL